MRTLFSSLALALSAAACNVAVGDPGTAAVGAPVELAPAPPPCDPWCTPPDWHGPTCRDVPATLEGRGARRVCPLEDGTAWEYYEADPGLESHYVVQPGTWTLAEAKPLCDVVRGKVVWRDPEPSTEIPHYGGE